MEQTVAWIDDIWDSYQEDITEGWGGFKRDSEEWQKAREACRIKREGVVLSTCWTPFRGIVATVRCTDGQIRTVAVSALQSEPT